jgi:aryl-alcohol dehydrogenase-like predicted oxidoreductase
VQTLPLGKSPVAVTRVVHGCMGFSDDAALAIRSIHAAFDAGVTTFDTAPIYGFGRSEELLGKAIADRRGRVQILTKGGLRWDADHGKVLFEAARPDGTKIVVRRDSRPLSLEQEVERSLSRLGTDTIDLLQIHHRDPDTPLAETMATLDALVREGKVRAVGVSNYSRQELDESAARLGSTPLASAQLEYNLLKRGIEADVLPWTRERDVAVLAYSPLGQGVLGGRQLGGKPLPSDWRRGTAYFERTNVEAANDALTRTVLPIAAAHGIDAGQVCLAWVLAQPGLTAVIVGAGSPAQAAANAAAAEIRLSDDELAALRATFERIELAPPSWDAGGVGGRVRSLLSRLREAASSGKVR